MREAVETLDEMMQLVRDTEIDADMLRKLLRAEIEAGQIDVESEDRTILIRIRERGSFTSGSAYLNNEFVAVIDKIGTALGQIEGRIFVEGHTDSIPINSFAYPSNWDLSVSRAASVTRRLVRTENQYKSSSSYSFRVCCNQATSRQFKSEEEPATVVSK